jgi:hypothetical protein
LPLFIGASSFLVAFVGLEVLPQGSSLLLEARLILFQLSSFEVLHTPEIQELGFV